MPKIHVALVASEIYTFPMLAAAASVAVFSKPETELVFHLFMENATDERFAMVAGELQRLRPCQVLRHDCDMRRINELNLASWRGGTGTKNIWIRTFLSELLPDVDWCISLDCDVLCYSRLSDSMTNAMTLIWRSPSGIPTGGCGSGNRSGLPIRPGRTLMRGLISTPVFS